MRHRIPVLTVAIASVALTACAGAADHPTAPRVRPTLDHDAVACDSTDHGGSDTSATGCRGVIVPWY